MQCKCGFKNLAGAKFCGSCGLALADGPGSAVANAAASSTAPPVAAGGARAGARPLSRARMAIVAAVVVVAAAGYWWLNRPPGRYKPDNSGLYPISVNGKYGFMDRSGKTVITPQFDGTYGFSEGLAVVRVGTKFGYIDTKGAVVITPQFDEAGPFRYGRAAVKLCCGPYWDGSDVEVGRIGKNRYGFIDTDGKYVGTPGFLWVAMLFDGDFALVREADGRVGIMNRSGKVVIAGNVEGVWISSRFSAGLAPAVSGGKWGYIDTTGKWVIDPQFEGAKNFGDGLAPVTVGGRTGYINEKGRFVVNPQYDPETLGSLNEFYDGYARFASGGKVGFIDTKGRVVSDAKFPLALPFSEGLAPVNTKDGWGFIDRTGKMVVSPQFDGADMFQNGLARVTVLGKEAYVTTAGAFVVDPFPGTNPHAERARLAAEAAQAATEVAQAAANANVANRSRVEQGIAGEWVGNFGRLTITSQGGAIGAVLLSPGGWREVLHGELLGDNILLLTGTSATRVGSSSSGTYSLDTVHLELSGDGGSLAGQFRDANGRVGNVAMQKSRP